MIPVRIGAGSTQRVSSVEVSRERSLGTGAGSVQRVSFVVEVGGEVSYTCEF